MLNPFSQYLHCTVLSKNSMILSARCFHLSADFNLSLTVIVTYSKVVSLLLHYSVTRIRNCCSQLHCIEFNVPGTNFSIKQLRGKNVLLQNRVRSTQSVFDTAEPDVVCLRHLQGADRQECACPPSPLMLFSSLRSDHLKETINNEQSRNIYTNKKTRSTSNEPPTAQRSPQKKKI